MVFFPGNDLRWGQIIMIGAETIPFMDNLVCFGGGIGGSRDGVCGALSGGVIAIGYLLGRVKPDENVDKAKAIAAEFKSRFEKEYGTSTCSALLDKFEPQENFQKCRHMVGKMAGLLARVLKTQGLKMKR